MMTFLRSLQARFALATATMCFIVSSALAQVAAEPLPMAPDVAAIVQRGKLVVAMTAFDNPPFYS